MTRRKIIYGLAAVIMTGAFVLYLFPVVMLDKACGQAGCISWRIMTCQGLTGGINTGNCTPAPACGTWRMVTPGLIRTSRYQSAGWYGTTDTTWYIALCASG